MKKQIWSSLLEIFFPARCVLCKSWKVRRMELCPACLAGIDFVTGKRCSCCGAEIYGAGYTERLCGNCLAEKTYYASVHSCIHYEKNARLLLHRFKFSGDLSVTLFFRELLLQPEAASFVAAAQKCDMLVPVPLHVKKMRKRGFNQAVVIAGVISGVIGVKVRADALKRLKNSVSQSALSKKDRRNNVRGNFWVKSDEVVRGKRICLVDDIFTTGATTNECARILCKSGASEVVVLVIARTDRLR